VKSLSSTRAAAIKALFKGGGKKQPPSHCQTLYVGRMVDLGAKEKGIKRRKDPASLFRGDSSWEVENG